MKFQLPDLPYAYDALEPHIDAETMKIHHTKHHQGYTDKLNKAIEGTELEGQSIEQILEQVSNFPPAVRNNGGGFYNHSLFWRILSPDGGGQPDKGLDIGKSIARKFGTFEQFKKTFKDAALSRFGSGWAWLCVDDPVGDLFIQSTQNQDNPLMDVVQNNRIPILSLDVWEHAYYLKYQNRRADYVDAFFDLINWEAVNENFMAARKEAKMV
ncbi:MAG TPA: superoxide dismutase [Flavilitoribacter sp.]|nr:superoxide dismutase [Flavilitoribacter sp.]HMQ88232.1 superoxide dismutase [Flavilitoribacter sp.]